MAPISGASADGISSDIETPDEPSVFGSARTDGRLDSVRLAEIADLGREAELVVRAVDFPSHGRFPVRPSGSQDPERKNAARS
jgi:hypothetical protein